MNPTTALYNPAFIFDKIEKENLCLLFGPDFNGDIYDTSNPSSPKLICSSGKPFLKIQHRKQIFEKILRTTPSFDATLLRIFWHNEKWYLSTRKHIDAFDNTWQNSSTFGALFENFVAFENLDLFLDQDQAYTFLLVSPEIQNVLPNENLELLHVYTYNRVTDHHEDQPIRKPHFARKIVTSRITGWMDEIKMKRMVDGEEQTKSIAVTKMARPQRGWLFTGQETRRVYQLDFHYFEKMENVVQNRPWKMVFYDLMKKKVTDKPMEMTLESFFEFYKNENFLAKWLYLQHIAKYICQCYKQGVAPTQTIVKQIWDTVLERNKRTTLTNSFVLRQIVYQKYVVLDALLASEFYPVLITPPPFEDMPSSPEGSVFTLPEEEELTALMAPMGQEQEQAQQEQEQEEEPLMAFEASEKADLGIEQVD